MTTLTTESPVPQANGRRFGRTAWMVTGGLAIAAAGMAAGLAWRPAPTDLAPMEPTKASLAANESVVESGADKGKPATDAKPVVQKRTTPTAAVCTHCGVVEGVREVEVKGQGTGLGAIAGGVVGGAVGNQVGKGNGRKAMTVLGAIGGGLAGHEIEKRARSEKVYEVRVRMDDGSVRTLTQKAAPAPGARVTVEGNTLRTTRASQGDAQTVRTSTGG